MQVLLACSSDPATFERSRGGGDVRHDFANAGDEEALVRVEVRPALKMEQLFETAVALAEQGRTMMGGIPKPLDLALFVRDFEQEVQAAFPPRWVQRLALAPLAWFAGRRRERVREAVPELAPCAQVV